MRQGTQRRVARETACWVSALALAVLPGAVQGAESVAARGLLTVEPSVGATFSVDFSQDLLLQIGLPGQGRTIRPNPALPFLVLNFENTEIVAESAVSLRLERRASPSPPPGAIEEMGEGDALLILAQFN